MNSLRVSRAEVRDLGLRLSGRDRAIIWQVGELRLMSGRQIEAVHFPSELHATAATAGRHCRRVLERLVRDRLLVRLERQVGGVRAGSQTFIYSLEPIGHRLLHEDGTRLRTYEPGLAFVDHQLAVTQLVVDLIGASPRRQLELLGLQGEPVCWRNLPDVGRAVLRPDLYLVIGVGELEYRWFVEVDRATHHAPSLLRKARLYESYYRSGMEQAKHEVFPRVIWVTPNKARAEAVERVLGASEFTPELMVTIATENALRVLIGAAA